MPTGPTGKPIVTSTASTPQVASHDPPGGTCVQRDTSNLASGTACFFPHRPTMNWSRDNQRQHDIALAHKVWFECISLLLQMQWQSVNAKAVKGSLLCSVQSDGCVPVLLAIQVIWQCVKTLYPFCSHQNSWDWWMFIPLKMVWIGIDPYPFMVISWHTTLSFRIPPAVVHRRHRTRDQFVAASQEGLHPGTASQTQGTQENGYRKSQQPNVVRFTSGQNPWWEINNELHLFQACSMQRLVNKLRPKVPGALLQSWQGFANNFRYSSKALSAMPPAAAVLKQETRGARYKSRIPVSSEI